MSETGRLQRTAICSSHNVRFGVGYNKGRWCVELVQGGENGADRDTVVALELKVHIAGDDELCVGREGAGEHVIVVGIADNGWSGEGRRYGGLGEARVVLNERGSGESGGLHTRKELCRGRSSASSARECCARAERNLAFPRKIARSSRRRGR